MRGLFRGSCHVIVEVDDEWDAAHGADCRGLPAREVWVDGNAKHAQAVMDRVFQTGRDESVMCISGSGVVGTAAIAQVRVDGRPWGVVVEWFPLAVPAPAPTVSPRESESVA